MARLASIGFETGDLSELVATSGTSAAASTTWADGGTYALRITSGSAQIYQGAEKGEFLVAMPFRHNGVQSFFGVILSWTNGATVLGSVRINPTAHTISIYVGNTSVATSVGALANLNTKYVMSIHVKIADADGIIEVRADGQDMVSFSGDTKPGANTGATDIYIGSPTITYSFTNYAYFDSILLNDTTGPGPDNTWPDYAPLYPIFPTGNGTYSQMTGSDGNQVDNYALVDDMPGNGDTDYVKATQADLIDSYAATDPVIPEGATINSVIIKASPRKTNAAVDTQIAIGLRSGGVDAVGADTSLPTAYGQMIQQRFTLDPADNQAWTPEKINALELLIKSRGAYA
jgi:hypothetical protein